MTPEQLVASIILKKEEDASKPDPEQEFTKAQVEEVINTLKETNKAMVDFLRTNKPTVSVSNFPAYPSEIKTPDVKEVTKAVKDLEKSLKPETYDDAQVVKALRKLADQQEQLLHAITGITVQPEVNVAAPIVNVEKPDLQPLETAIKESKPDPLDLTMLLDKLEENITATKKVTSTLTKLKFPVPNVPTDPLIYYLPADVDDTGATQYFGYTDNKGAWYIRKYDTSVNPKTIRLCFGQADYASNWTNRASLTYATWGS